MCPSGSLGKVQLTSESILVTGIPFYVPGKGNIFAFAPEAMAPQKLFFHSNSLITHRLPTFSNLLLFALNVIALLGRGNSSTVFPPISVAVITTVLNIHVIICITVNQQEFFKPKTTQKPAMNMNWSHS